jgi:hypothetical protein
MTQTFIAPPTKAAAPDKSFSRIMPDLRGVPAVDPYVPVNLGALSGLTIKELKTYKRASVFVVDFLLTTGKHFYIKTKQGVTEIGGTEDWGTGQQE